MLTWLLMGLALGAPEMIPEEDADLVGRTAPAIAGPLLDGGDFTLEAVRGKPVVMSFWASWCGPCRKELPDLSRLAKEREDVVFIAVNVDRNRAKAERFLSQVPVTVPIVWDHKSVALGAYQVLSMPTMFVIDRNGTVKHRKVGYGTDAGLSEIEAVLDGLR